MTKELSHNKGREDRFSADYIRSILDYCPKTGQLTWKSNRGRNQLAGKVAGCHDRYGYVSISIFGDGYRAHRLAWMIVYGKAAEGEIDHINGVKNDNRIDNLREVDGAANQKNRKMQSNNKSGHTGVYWNKRQGKWTSQIRINRKTIYIGSFKEIEDAVVARKFIEKVTGFHPNHGRQNCA